MNNKPFVKILMFVFELLFQRKEDREYRFLCRVKERAVANENGYELLKCSKAQENLKSVLSVCSKVGSLRESLKCCFWVESIC